ncbi:MAG TPA: YqiA/YcfP family alpha/beta fold hydrolase [Rhodocyclaceae bacterium]|nr:YqiA/YcfP family alpha/beta fold hydrolase [Rhodocyclaceae bacterium]
MLLYLHGFKSSPRSAKSQQLAERAAQRNIPFACPQLPVSAAESIALAEAIMAKSATPVTLVGSSLGGFYATWLAEKHGCRAVLVNPAVVAHLSLEQYLGPQANFHTGEEFEFTRDHIAQLHALEVPAITRPERYWLLAETGDEVLDYLQAVAKYVGAKQTVLEGGDHSFSRWGEYMDGIIDFALA